jgi:hypothetical protein
MLRRDQVERNLYILKVRHGTKTSDQRTMPNRLRTGGPKNQWTFRPELQKRE